MACGGPSKDEAYKIGEAIAKDFLSQMKNNYNILTGEIYKKCASKNISGAERDKAKWDELEAKFRETIKEMVWLDHSSSF